MKKNLAIVAFCAITIFANNLDLAAASPRLDKQFLQVDQLKSKALANSALRIFDAIKLDITTKSGEAFQAEGQSEVMMERFLGGQYGEFGPMNNYFTYEPYTQTIWGVENATISIQNEPDSVKKKGTLYYGKYTGAYPITLQSVVLYDENFSYNFPNVNDLRIWNYGAIAVMNPTKSTNIEDLSVTFASNIYDYDINGYYKSSSKFFSLTNVNEIVQGITPHSIFNSSPINGGPRSNYVFSSGIKAIGAEFDGDPYALFWGVMEHPTDNTQPNCYGFVSINMKTPLVGDDNIDKFQDLPNSVMNIFGNAVMSPTASNYNAMGLDYDKNGNIYLGFCNPTATRYANEDFATYWKTSQIPLVVKTKFVPGAADVISTGWSVDSCPVSVIENYIYENGGVIDYDDDNTAWDFGDKHYSRNILFDIAFNVVNEDEFSFLLPLGYSISTEEYTIDLVEVTCKNHVWKFNFIKKVDEDWNSGIAAVGSQFASIFAPYTIFEDSTYQGVPTIKATNYTDWLNNGLQLARTADNKYLVAKWQQTTANPDNDPALPTDQFNVESPIRIFSQYGTADNPTIYEYNTNVIYKSRLMLSYKEIGTDVWSKPVYADGVDSVSMVNTLMPRTITDIDNVPVAFGFTPRNIQGNPRPLHIAAPALLANNWKQYKIASLIFPSAKTGPKLYENIKEGEIATINTLGEAFPNPANDMINFKFSLSKPADTKLTITNALGQTIAVIVDQFCNANEYSVDFNTNNIPNGTYYFTLTSGEMAATKMFNVVR